MKILYTWKLIRTTRRIQIRSPFVRHMSLTIRTWNRPPPVICLTNVRNRENIPGWVPPSSVSCSTALRHTRHCLLSCHTLCSIVCFIFIVSSPLFLPVDSETDAAPGYDYAADNQPLSVELPGKQNPLDHSYIAHSFSPMLALDFATVFDCSYSDAWPNFVTCCWYCTCCPICLV